MVKITQRVDAFSRDHARALVKSAVTASGVQHHEQFTHHQFVDYLNALPQSKRMQIKDYYPHWFETDSFRARPGVMAQLDFEIFKEDVFGKSDLSRAFNRLNLEERRKAALSTETTSFVKDLFFLPAPARSLDFFQRSAFRFGYMKGFLFRRVPDNISSFHDVGAAAGHFCRYVRDMDTRHLNTFLYTLRGKGGMKPGTVETLLGLSLKVVAAREMERRRPSAAKHDGCSPLK